MIFVPGNYVENFGVSAKLGEILTKNTHGKARKKKIRIRCDVSIQALSGETAFISMDNIDMENTVMQKFGIKTAFKHCFHRRV